MFKMQIKSNQKLRNYYNNWTKVSIYENYINRFLNRQKRINSNRSLLSNNWAPWHFIKTWRQNYLKKIMWDTVKLNKI